jgi:hypothetical protein
MAKGQKQIMDWVWEKKENLFFSVQTRDENKFNKKRVFLFFLKVSIILNGILRFLQVNNLIIKGDENYFTL